MRLRDLALSLHLGPAPQMTKRDTSRLEAMMHERTMGSDRASGRNLLHLLAGCGLHPLDGAELFAAEPAKRSDERAAPSAYFTRPAMKHVA